MDIAPLKAMLTTVSKWSRIQDSFWIIPKIESLVVFVIPDIPWKFQKLSVTFWVILVTDIQTDKQTGENTTSLAEVIKKNYNNSHSHWATINRQKWETTINSLVKTMAYVETRMNAKKWIVCLNHDTCIIYVNVFNRQRQMDKQVWNEIETLKNLGGMCPWRDVGLSPTRKRRSFFMCVGI